MSPGRKVEIAPVTLTSLGFKLVVDTGNLIGAGFKEVSPSFLARKVPAAPALPAPLQAFHYIWPPSGVSIEGLEPVMPTTTSEKLPVKAGPSLPTGITKLALRVPTIS